MNGFFAHKSKAPPQYKTKNRLANPTVHKAVLFYASNTTFVKETRSIIKQSIHCQRRMNERLSVRILCQPECADERKPNGFCGFGAVFENTDFTAQIV